MCTGDPRDDEAACNQNWFRMRIRYIGVHGIRKHLIPDKFRGAMCGVQHRHLISQCCRLELATVCSDT